MITPWDDGPMLIDGAAYVKGPGVFFRLRAERVSVAQFQHLPPFEARRLADPHYVVWGSSVITGFGFWLPCTDAEAAALFELAKARVAEQRPQPRPLVRFEFDCAEPTFWVGEADDDHPALGGDANDFLDPGIGREALGHTDLSSVELGACSGEGVAGSVESGPGDFVALSLLGVNWRPILAEAFKVRRGGSDA